MSDAKRMLPKWREDFPVKWEDDHYVTRRELTKFLTLGSALLAGANVAVAVAASTRKPTEYTPARIASASSLAAGQSMLFRYPTDADPCVLVRLKDGTLAAFSSVCTHLSCAVVYRAEGPDGEQLFCPCHNGAFACSGGHGGARPTAGPPERPLPRIVIEARGDDVWAIGVET